MADRMAKAMSARMASENLASENELLDTVSKTIETLGKTTRITGSEEINGDENLAARNVFIRHEKNIINMPLQKVNLEVPSFYYRKRSEIQNPTVVGLKINPYSYGEEVDQPLLSIENAHDVKQINVETPSGIESSVFEKKCDPTSYQIMKIYPERGLETLVWVTPGNKSHAFDMYFDYGIIPDPDKLIFRDLIPLPSNTFTHKFSLRKCESELECQILDEDDPEGTETGSPFGFKIPLKGELDFCFSKFGDKCQIVFALTLNDIDPTSTSTVRVETINAGCRTLVKGGHEWDRTTCSLSLRSTLNRTVCDCHATEDAFSVTSDILVPPRKLDFAAIRSPNMDGPLIMIISFSVGLITVYLLGTFYAQRHDRLDKRNLAINDLRKYHQNAADVGTYLIVIGTRFLVFVCKSTFHSQSRKSTPQTLRLKVRKNKPKRER